MATPKTGPLTVAELQAIWEATSDPGYWQPLEQAGEGNGFEAHVQAWVQMALASVAIDRTTQALFLLPWSGQSDLPASGPMRATVSLSLTRTGLLNLPLILAAGQLVEEQQVDWGSDGGVTVLTGRRYALQQAVTFEPGQQGPLVVLATAERPGFGYNYPRPGTISRVDQVGAGYSNTLATIRGNGYPSALVLQGFAQQVLVDCQDQPDTFLPDHVGQYLLFTAGANAGAVGRAVAYLPPNPPATGGTLQLELQQSILAAAFSGTFQVGEFLVLKNGGTITGYGKLIDAQQVGSNLLVTFTILCGSAVTTVVGQGSGASATIQVDQYFPAYTPENATASWRVLDWVLDWGLSCTNSLSPAGGRSGDLDVVGKERNAPRATGEQDSGYRARLAQIGDTVSPNALRRALNRADPGLAWLFLEAGTTFPGCFLDHDALDQDLVAVQAASTTGTFQDGEIAVQNNDGVLTIARALVGRAPAPVVPGPPGAAQTPAFAGFQALLPYARQVLTTTNPVVGQRSGASMVLATTTPGLALTDRYRVLFDYLHMRAWFYVGAPLLDQGDPGFALDTHPHDALDTISPMFAALDGQPWGNRPVYAAAVNALQAAHAGGVGFDLFPYDASFDPGTVGPLIARYEAAQAYLDSSLLVRLLPDLSNQGHDASQATATLRPSFIATDSKILGQSTAQNQAGATTVLSASFPDARPISPPFTFYWLGYTDGTVNAGIFDTSLTRYFLFASATQLDFRVNGLNLVVTSPPTSPTVACGTVDVSGGAAALYVNAITTPGAAGTTPAASGNGLTMTLFDSAKGGATCALLFFSGVHSAAQRKAIMQWLGARGGVSVAP